jgi:hypothetical protein
MSSKTRTILLCSILSTACIVLAEAQHVGRGSVRRFYPDDPLTVDPEALDVPRMKEWDLSRSHDFFENTFGLEGTDGPALNANSLDEVPDSSWFTNRIGTRDMSIDEILRGPDTSGGPAPGVLLVTGRPWTGLTPKFTVRDSRGDTYLLKLDPVIVPELPSSVEIISTKIFHAIGYWVPEDYLLELDPQRLRVGEGAVFVTENGFKKRIEPRDVEHWLEAAPRTSSGGIRVVASRYVPGKVVGQYRYHGTRPDDPNDIFPHERRRELRGLRVFAAWLNHDDARSLNSIDSWVEVGGRHLVRHYLQDFGSNMGSGSTSAQQPRAGYEYIWEPNQVLKRTFTLGLSTPAWSKVKYPDYRGVGNYEADFFEPEKWKTEYPNPAFLRMDAADAFWAARIAARFTDDILAAVVKAGKLSDPRAEAYVLDVLRKRRDKAVRYWITRTNPLDEFRVSSPEAGSELTFDNAAIRVGAASPGATYRVGWSKLENLVNHEVIVRAPVPVESPRVPVPEESWGPRDDAGYRYAIADIQTLHPDFPHWTAPVRVSLRMRDGAVDVVGIERPRVAAKPGPAR